MGIGALSAGTNGRRLKQGNPMATSFYDLSVPTFLQTVRAVGGFLDRAARHCAETGANPDDFVRARLFDDMAPFHFQIEAGGTIPCGGWKPRRPACSLRPPWSG